jgi:transposase
MNMTNMNRGQWTTKDVERLREEWAKGTSTKNIATLLGRTQGSVYTRLSMLRKSGVDIERRGESTGPVKPSRKGGPKNVLPTGEDVKPKSEKPAEKKVELTQFMVEMTNEEFKDLRDANRALRSDNTALRLRINQMNQAESEGAVKLVGRVADENDRLKRENAVLRAALIASNNVIAVFMAQDGVED